MDLVSDYRPEIAAGGIARDDTTTAFYLRVNALVRPEFNVLDLGAGRGAQLEGDLSYRVALRRLKGRVNRLVGCDVDPAVLQNPHLDEAHVLDPSGRTPYEDSAFDLIYSDWVIEHLDDPQAFAAEVGRILKPGGWFCARTPNKWGYIALGARLTPKRLEAGMLQLLQPGRQERDVFEKRYRLNTLGDVRRAFPDKDWLSASFRMNATPAYHGGSSLMFKAIDAFQMLTPAAMNTVLLIFLQKKPTPHTATQTRS